MVISVQESGTYSYHCVNNCSIHGESNIYFLVISTTVFRRLLWRRNRSDRLGIQLTAAPLLGQRLSYVSSRHITHCFVKYQNTNNSQRSRSP